MPQLPNVLAIYCQHFTLRVQHEQASLLLKYKEHGTLTRKPHFTSFITVLIAPEDSGSGVHAQSTRPQSVYGRNSLQVHHFYC